jgi:hypothetical protein
VNKPFQFESTLKLLGISCGIDLILEVDRHIHSPEADQIANPDGHPRTQNYVAPLPRKYPLQSVSLVHLRCTL